MKRKLCTIAIALLATSIAWAEKDIPKGNSSLIPIQPTSERLVIQTPRKGDIRQTGNNILTTQKTKHAQNESPSETVLQNGKQSADIPRILGNGDLHSGDAASTIRQPGSQNISSQKTIYDQTARIPETRQQDISRQTGHPILMPRQDTRHYSVKDNASISRNELPAVTVQTRQIEAATSFAGGTGSESNPYQISNAAELAYLAQQVNNGNNYSNTYFILTADIQLNDTTDWKSWDETTAPANSWTPIGTGWDNPFSGSFDGQGYIVSGIYINTTSDFQGLFGYIDYGNRIQNIGIKASYIKGYGRVGGVAGAKYGGTMYNCYNSGTIIGTYYVGGVIGEQNSSDAVTYNCYNNGSVSGNQETGGITGMHYGVLSNCYNIGQINGNYYSGGITGNNSGLLTKCYNSGTIYGTYFYIGSIAGINSGTLNDCYYLTNCAIAENGIVQNGIGANQGETTADTEGVTTAKTAGEFASGEVCWLLNGQTAANVVWYQTLGIDTAPVLDSTHGTVYANGGCQGKPATFKNNGPSEYGAHIDNNDDGHCDICGQIILTEPANVDGVYQIANRAELYWFAALVNGTLKDGTKQNTAAQAVLIADILLNDTTNWRNWNETTNGLDQWTPIGHYNYQFTGLFDGQGHSISGIYINTASNYQGLFGYNNGTIQNIGVTASYIKGNECVGGIAGYSDNGTLTNCYNNGMVKGYWNTGGIAGYNSNNMITNCHNTGIINGDYYTGGITGYNWGTVTSCYNHGMINGIESIGGITGANDKTMANCYNTGTVNGNYRVGGITGYNWNIITNCYYLAGCATDGNGTVQNGIGANQGETTADTEGATTAKTTEEFASGEVCWLLNGQTDTDVIWYQTLDIDAAPVLDGTHSTVYANGGCQGKPAAFKNNGPSEYGAHTDNDNDGHCDFCGEIIMTEPANVDGVYQIANRAELYWFAALVNGTLKDGKEQNTAAQAVLIADIQLNDTTNWRNWNETTNGLDQWTPIGHYNYQFTGLFDGQGHTISGIYINTANSYQGLFGYVGGSGVVQNLGVIAGHISSTNGAIGGITGFCYGGTIANCYNSCFISGYNGIGGIAGYNNGSSLITNCYNNGNINGKYSLGGIAGTCYATISNSYNVGTINGNYYTGSIAGEVEGTITNCYYLADCATDGNGTVQNGIGAENQGEITADIKGITTAKTADEFASGEVCWLLNGQTDTDVTWYQTLDIDAAPVLDGTHGTVYANGGCQGKPAAFKNNGPSEYGAHTDNDNDGHCDFCGEIIMTEPANVDGVYQIANRAELYWFAALVNGTLKDGTKQNTAAQAVLIADILLNDTTNWRNWNETTNGLDQWTPIGYYNNSSDYILFNGSFDGQGHTVSGIYINTTSGYQGLFGCNDGTIQNVGVTASYIKGNEYVGGIAGYNNNGTLTNCYNAGSINGSFCTGGITGYSLGVVTNCYNIGTIIGSEYTGGILGANDGGTVTNCYTTGTINGNYIVGSITGYNWNIITNCYYLAGCATDGNGTVQNGIGAENQGEITADIKGITTAKTADEFASGEVCWLLNGQTDTDVTWYQTLDIDAAPVLDGTHGTVYANGGCPSKPAAFKNEGPSIGKHTDNDNDGHCDICGEIIMTEPANIDGVYQIANRAELYWFAALVNGTLKDGTEQNTAAQAVLIADIQLNDTTDWKSWDETTAGLGQWMPIGYYNSSSDYILFNGSFDGQGHTVSGIYINTTRSYQGLFGFNNGTIQNIGVTASYIKGNQFVGGIAGYNNNGMITNCHNTGIINGDYYTGGITGYNWGTVTSCYNHGMINGIESIGGITGANDRTMANCYNIGTVNGSYRVGGITGYNWNTITNCYYLAGCATDENETVQNGIGTNQGETTTDTEGITTAKTADEFASGEICWLLNNGQNELVWGQAIGTNAYPVLTTEHIVYKVPFINKNTGFELMGKYGNDGTELSLPTAEELGVVLIKEFTDNNGNKLENSFIVSPDLIITVDCSAYTISVADNIRHGSITPEMTEAGAGNVIHITATAEEHYMFSQLHVSYDGNTESQPDGETSFTMPAADVTLSASFIPMYAQNVSYDIEKVGIDTYNVIFTWERHTTAFTTNIYRDNVLVAENLTETTWTDTNIAKGTYFYTFELEDADGITSYTVGGNIDVWFYALVPQSGTENVTLGEDALPIYDNGGYNGNYANSSDGKLVINAQEGCRIKLTGNINTENNYDFVKIYDSDDTELYNSSGTYDIGTIISSGNSLSIAFTSDGSVIQSGFDLLAETVYPIAVATMKNGTVVPDTLWAAAGDIVTLQAIPSDGYQLIENSLTIRKLENPSIYTVVKDYQFVMPSYKIIIMAQFSGTTNINGTENGTWTVIGMEHCLQITGTDAEASIYDTTGRLMYRGLNRMINLPVSGIYIIRIGNEVQKAVVK